MSSVWLCIPSARPPAEAEKVLSKWRAQGYKIALWLDSGKAHPTCDLSITDECLYNGVRKYPRYPGYAIAVNELVGSVMMYDPHAEWFVTGGDDVEPDMNHTAEEIGFQLGRHFGDAQRQYRMEHVVASFPLPPQPSARMPWSTFGVMQPTGDRFAGGSIDRICGSPWMGREFCRRVNGGRGPLWPDYVHMFVDEELLEVARKLGVFQQRRDLIHLHRHFMRASDDLNSHAVSREVPAHLVEANSQHHWDKYQAIFNARKAAGFPGHEPLPVAELAAQ